MDLLPLAAPLALEMLLGSGLVLFQAVLVARLDAEALAGLGAASAVWGMGRSLSALLATGGIVVVARAEGEGQRREAISAVFGTHLMYGAIETCVWLVAGGFFLSVMGLSPEAAREGMRYLRPLSLLPFLGSFALASRVVFLGLGRTWAAFSSGIATILTALAFLAVLIPGGLGVAPLGTLGAGLAECLAPILGGLPLLAILRREGLFFVPARRHFTGPVAREILRLGLPASPEGLLYQGSVAALLRVAALGGSGAVGTIFLTKRLLMPPVALVVALAQATMIRVGQENHRSHSIGRSALTFGFGVAALFSFVCGIAPNRVASFAGASAQEGIAPLLPWVWVLLCPQMANIIIGGALRGRGEAKWMLFSQAVGFPVAPLAAYLFAFVLGGGGFGLLAALALDEGVRAGLNYRRFSFPSTVLPPPVASANLPPRPLP